MSPVEQIVDWVKEKPIWWQHTVRIALQNGELSEVDLDEIHHVALMEHGLREKDDIWFGTQQPILTTGFEQEEAEVTLKSISQVKNVGSLAEDQLLEFSSSGLTIIYGDNGAGKSSYSKILKHACLARGKPPLILGNVFENSGVPSSALLSVTVNGRDNNKSWSLDFTGDLDIKSIRIFDGEVADNFVTDEDELGYKPAGLHLLEGLVAAIDLVKRRVIEECMPGNGLVSLPEFGDTKIGDFVRNLSSETDITKIKKYTIKDDEPYKSDQLVRDISDLKSKSPKRIRKELENKKQQLLPLKNFLEKAIFDLDNKVYEKLKTMSLDVSQKLMLSEKLRQRLLVGLPLKGIGGEEWQNMWNAAEKYMMSMEENRNFPPEKEEICPFCLQDISANTATKLEQFREFLLDQSSLQANEAKSKLENEQQKLQALNIEAEPYQAAITLLEGLYPNFEENFNGLIDQLLERKTTFSSESIPESIPELCLDSFNQLKTQIKYIENSLKNIKENSSILKVINIKERELDEFNDKKLFNNNIEQIKNNINRYKELNNYEKLELECKPRSVTDLNTKICKSEIITPLVDSFDEELKEFNFNRFKVSPKTRGSLGAQLLKLEILASGKPLVAKVASDGEQRCIAIACFLAEMRADKRKSAVIFDDPVSSLSHKWSSRVAKRLVKESLNRQVIVLTHDIVFYKLLLEEIENLEGSSSNEICLESSRKKAGIVRDIPPWDALTTSKRIKQLKVKLRKLKTIDHEGTEREFREEAYAFYGYLREAWERLVEEKLLNQVVTRFGRGVQTNRLKRLVDLKQEDFQRIDAGMSKCSTYFRGHDSAPAAGDPYPTIQEIETDIKAIEEFNNELQTQRKRT